LIAEGRADDSSSQLWFTNENEKLIDDYIKTAENQLGVKPEKKDYDANCWDAIIYSQNASKIMQKFGVYKDGSGGKTVPEFFMKHAGEKEIKAFLEGLYAGDGTVSHTNLSLTTKSKKLVKRAQNLWLRLGITSRIRERQKNATNSDHSGGTYYDLQISGVKQLQKAAKKLEIPVERKQVKLQKLIEKDHNPNHDLIEANNLVEKISDEQDLQVTQIKEDHSRLASYCYKQCTPSRDGLKELLGEVFRHGERTEKVKKLEKIVNSDIYWDEVKEIERIGFEDDWVYDLNVAVDHNFVAENTIIHNSNIIDAISFVFGKRSSQLRAKKLEQLIFNGGESRKPADYAHVTVVLDNSSGIFDEFLDEDEEKDEIKVGRKITRAGSSMYKFEGTNCKASKIQEVAQKANIDPDGYHFVRQGKVTEIVKQSPVSRRKVVDELSGVKEFDEKKEEAEEELQEVEDKLQEQEILLDEKKEYLNKLKDEKEKALQYRELEQRKEKIQASVLEVRKRAISNQLANLNTDVSDKKDRLEEVEEKLEELDEQIDRKQDRIKEIEDQMGGNNDIKHLENKIEKKKGEIQNKRDRIKDLEDTIKSLKRMKNNRNTGSKAVDAVLGLDDDRIHGVFQDLVSYEDRFSIAIDTAAGSRMKNVVVEDRNAATEAINYLKRENIGRATMMPLDKIKDRSRSAKSKMAKKKKGVIGYAADLVDYNGKYEKAVNYVFSDTLIAEDLDSVKNIDGVRVVTLDGDIMKRGGAMTGGKKKKKRGKSSSKSSNMNVDKKKKEKEELEGEKHESEQGRRSWLG
jgi:chromosome segregation ATPase